MTRLYAATVYIHTDDSLQHAHRRQAVQFEYSSQHRNGSQENKKDCKRAAVARYGNLAIPCEIVFTHIIHK